MFKKEEKTPFRYCIVLRQDSSQFATGGVSTPAFVDGRRGSGGGAFNVILYLTFVGTAEWCINCSMPT